MPESMLPMDPDHRITVDLAVNGSEHRIQVTPQMTLLDVLTRVLHLTGTREGCGIGVCGACTVLVDDQPLSACLLLAFQVQGHRIVTVEGLSASGELHPVQRAFAEATAFQCSYCTPGFVLATHALLNEHPDVDAEMARTYLSGNLCRCGSYVKILTAVLSLAVRDVE
jgi:aerobic-type carbon monoxide dehydrogenase small subunit (CoxS/CutS family)